MGIMTHLVELTRHDYIYVKERLKINDILTIEPDNSRFWEGPNGYISALEDITSLEAWVYVLSLTDSNLCQFG